MDNPLNTFINACILLAGFVAFCLLVFSMDARAAERPFEARAQICLASPPFCSQERRQLQALDVFDCHAQVLLSLQTTMPAGAVMPDRLTILCVRVQPGA